MPLPELIEIVPPAKPAAVRLTMPGSKSITNRALILAALAKGACRLRGASWSEDTEAMADCLRRLGFEVEASAPDEDANCGIVVGGRGGEIPLAGSRDLPLELDVKAAGTAARFLLAMVCLGRGSYRLSGTPRMHQRPQKPLIDALRRLGYEVESESGRLPAVVHGAGPHPGSSCEVSIEESSQFASALLLSARAGGWHVSVRGEDAEESAYVAMTLRLMEVFPHAGGDYQIEPDASGASYFLAAGALLGVDVEIEHWPDSGWQIDARFRDLCRGFARDRSWPGELSRLHDLGDSIMTAVVLAPFLEQPVRFTDLGRLRLQESERVAALRTELSRCGARVLEQGDTLEVFPSKLHGAEIETYDDHRVAMCFSVLGLAVPGMRIRNPACVAKTFPNFYAKLAAPPPRGLGAAVIEAVSGHPLSGDDLLP